jgi:RimJ/RimL family protein N-acetyltransferase
VRLRPVRPDEADELFALYRRTALVAYAHVFPPERYPFPDGAVRAHWRDVVAGSGRDRHVVVAEADGEVVGTVVATPGTLENLFVVPERWGTGVADELHDAALDVSRRAGADLCRLEVLEENRRARRFYERHGWSPDGRRRVGEFPPYPPVVGYAIPLRKAVRIV